MPNVKGRIEQEFDKLALLSFADISTEQYVDLRRMFYAGASALYFLLMSNLDSGDEPTAADLLMMRDLRNEIFAFNEEVKAGRA